MNFNIKIWDLFWQKHDKKGEKFLCLGRQNSKCAAENGS